MITEVISEKINLIEDKKKIPYLLENVFKSKLILGKISSIKNETSIRFMFVDLIVSSDLSKKYKIDNKEWQIYCNLNNVPKEIRDTLEVGDLIYFGITLNKIKPKQIIQVNGQTVKKLKSYKTFLEEIDVDIQSVRLDGSVALENEEEIRVWATQEFYNSFNLVYEDLLIKINEAKVELDNTRKKEKEIYESIEYREKKLIDKEIEMEKLGKKLAYFGFKSFQKEIVDNKPSAESLVGNSLDIFCYIKDYLRNNKQLIYSDDIIRRFFTALQSNELIILSGPSGTGKTSIVNAFADAVCGKSKIISVKPSWTETEDLIGFYNPIEKNYIPTPFLDALVEAKKDENKDKLYLICLDEMNLSHIEYYFAEFLSKLELSEDEPSIELYSTEIYNEILENIKDTINLISGDLVEPKIEQMEKWCLDNDKEYPKEIINLKQKINFIEKYPAIFKISKNVRFIGTINVDQTTKPISPKVIDRSFVIELLKYNKNLSEYNLSDKVIQKFVPSTEFNLNFDLDLNIEFERIKEKLASINIDYLEDLSCDFNNRTTKQIKKYLSNLNRWNKKFEENEILSDLITMKILPRINTSFNNRNEQKYRKWNDFNEEINNIVTDDVKRKLAKMDNSSKDDNVISFWGSY